MHSRLLIAAAVLSSTTTASSAQSSRLDAFASALVGRKSIALIDARADAVARLRRSPTHAIYTLDAKVKWLGFSRGFDECSVVRFDGERIVPLEFAHIDHGDATKGFRTEFDWAAGKAVTRLGSGEVRTADIAWPTWDPMSFQLALMSSAASKQPGDVETHAVIERGRHRAHRVVYEGPVASPVAGADKAFSVRSEKESGGTISLLLDPAQRFRLLRIVIEGVALDFVAPRPVPAPLPAGTVPRCPGAGAA